MMIMKRLKEAPYLAKWLWNFGACPNKMNFISILVVDASGRAESGFVWGNNYWISSRELCAVINDPIDLGLSDRYNRRNHKDLTLSASPFRVNYQVVYIRHRSIFQLDQKIYDKVAFILLRYQFFFQWKIRNVTELDTIRKQQFFSLNSHIRMYSLKLWEFFFRTSFMSDCACRSRVFQMTPQI